MNPAFAHIGDPNTNLIEECAELIQALTKLRRFGAGSGPYDNVGHVQSEISDVVQRIGEWRAALATQPPAPLKADDASPYPDTLDIMATLREPVGLTEEQIIAATVELDCDRPGWVIRFARAIEAALRTTQGSQE